MTERSDLDALLRELELELPDMTVDMTSFFREFEDRSEVILGVADDSEQAYVLDCLMIMLQKAGISQHAGTKPSTLP